MRCPSFRWLVAAAVTLALAGCGGSSASQTKADPATLQLGLMKSHELGGMSGQSTSPVTSATSWATAENLGPGAQNAEVARLRKLGFVAGIRESLAGQTQNRYGVSIVEQFKSSSGSVAELHHSVSTYGPWTLFAVPGIPGARGFEQDGAMGGRNIGFTHGDYYYLIGSGWQSGASNAVSRAAMIAVAQALYHKVSS